MIFLSYLQSAGITGMHHHIWLRCFLLGLLFSYHFKTMLKKKSTFLEQCRFTDKLTRRRCSPMLMVSERFSLIGHRLGHQCSSWIEGRKGLLTHNALRHVLWGQKAGMVGMLLLVLLAPNLVLLFHSSTSANKVANQFLQSEPSSNSPLTHLQTWQHGGL